MIVAEYFDVCPRRLPWWGSTSACFMAASSDRSSPRGPGHANCAGLVVRGTCGPGHPKNLYIRQTTCSLASAELTRTADIDDTDIADNIIRSTEMAAVCSAARKWTPEPSDPVPSKSTPGRRSTSLAIRFALQRTGLTRIASTEIRQTRPAAVCVRSPGAAARPEVSRTRPTRASFAVCFTHRGRPNVAA